MNPNLKFFESFKNLNHKTKFTFYVFLAIFLAGSVLFVSSFNTTKTYKTAADYTTTLGSYTVNQEKYINNKSIYNFPQGLIGERLSLFIRFDSQISDSNVTFYILLIPGGKLSSEKNYNDKVLNNIIPNLNEQNMRNFTSQIEKITYVTGNNSEFSTKFSFPADNAYTLVYLLSGQSIKANSNLVISFSVNYKIMGNDDLFFIFSIILIVISIIFLLAFVILYKNISINNLFKLKNETGSSTNLQPVVNSLSEIRDLANIKYTDDKPTLLNQINSLLRYEFKLLFEGPFLVVFLFLLLVMVQDSYYSVFNYWAPMGKSAFQELGPVVTSSGVLKYTTYLFIIITIILLFSFREIDEKIFEIHITLPRDKRLYIISKYFTILLPLIIFWFIFVITNIFIIPIRNPTIGYFTFNQILVISLSYFLLTLVLASFPFLLINIFMNSRIVTTIWIVFYLMWYSWSMSYLNQILYSNADLSKNLESNLTLGSIDRVFEYLVKRPLFPDLSSGYFTYVHDSLLNSIFILGIYLIISVFCFLLGIYIFRSRDL